MFMYLTWKVADDIMSVTARDPTRPGKPAQEGKKWMLLEI
jgi:hypothetical protein